MRGDSFLYPSAVTTLVRDYVERGGRGEEQFDVLTPRELEVLKLIAEAHTSKEIAADALHQHQDRRPPPPEHPRQARDARPRRADALRDPPRTDPAVGTFFIPFVEGADAAPALKIFRGARAPDPPTSTAQALTIIDALESCCSAGLSGLILLIEEPELYLRPQAQRYLYRLLRKFSLAGNQTIYSTHSPAFLNVVRLDELIFVERISRAGTRALQPEPVTPDDDFRVMTEFDAARSELFLARAVVLVEGLTEKLVLPFVFAALGHDVDREAISIIECGGKPNLPLFARICSATGIPHMIVHDSDRRASGKLVAAERALNALIAESVPEGHIVVLDPDFEAVAGLAGNSRKPERAWREFASRPSSEMPEPLLRAAQLAIRWPVVRRPDDTPGSPRPVRGFQRARS